MLERKEFAKEWYLKGEDCLKSEKIFESFIYLWLALTIAAKEHYGNNRSTERWSNNVPNDRTIIVFWSKTYAKHDIFEILEINKYDMYELCDRKDPGAQEPILDISINRNEDEGLYRKVLDSHIVFRDYWQGNMQHITKGEISKTFLHILHDVRNNLFHGDKSFSVESDRRLLEVLCPSLRSITKLCIEQLR
jgi:hypothetical protein